MRFLFSRFCKEEVQLADLIINLLTPIIVSMGASAADVANYVHAVEPQINIIMIALAIMILIMILAHWLVKKGNRHVVRWTAAIAWLVVVVICANAMVQGPLKSILTNVTSAPKAEFSEDMVANSRQVITEVGEDGITLVKNNGLLPLKDTKQLNVFGWASCYPVYSGTGSASAGDAGPAVSTLASLRDAGFDTYADLRMLYLNYSKTYKNDRPSITMQQQDWTLPEPPRAKYTDALMAGAVEYSDTAVIVIGRSGGENADLPADMNAVIHGTYNVAKSGVIDSKYATNYGYTGGVYTNNGDYDDFEPGEHYLQLSRTERDMVDLVCNTFKKVVVVINANNPMELDWVDQYESIGAVLLVPGTGNSGMAALGGILAGTVNPSGRTVDTYLKDLTKAPSYNHSGNSGNHIYTNADDLTKKVGRNDISFQGVISFTDYVEGIYMGYKFYETAADEGAINYDEYVQYPFGHGLSYTTFEQSIVDFKQDDTNVNVSVKVTNNGQTAGKDVVEVYFTPPYTNGGIEKASVNLLDFGKTGVLEPGASETITLTIPLENLASYDSACLKTANGGYVLEAGEYTVSIRKNSHEVIDSRAFTLASDVIYDGGRPSDKATVENRFASMEGTDKTYISRKDHFANLAEAVAPHAALELSKDDSKVVQSWAYGNRNYDPTDHDDPNDVMPTLGAKNGLTLADLAGKPYDDPQWEQLLDQLTVQDMITLINTAGWNTAAIESVGKVATSEFDGPSGYSNYLTGTMGTQFCTEVLLAQTWNKALAEKVGDAIAQEFASAKSFGWYGPAMNLHRSAFSGRNFEYYSEDGMLSGLIASAEVRGAAKFGVYPYLKHFAANDQETNRCAFLLTYMTEQNLRENVLRPFEMVVKSFDFDHYVLGIMTSYNFLGPVPVISNKPLLTDVLRGEWGFIGSVISDYNGSYGYQISDAAVRAGNDLMLGQGMAASNEFTDIDSATLVLAMRRACKNVLYNTANSGYYADAAAAAAALEASTSENAVDKMMGTVNLCAGLGLGLAEILVLVRWLLKKKKAKAA